MSADIARVLAEHRVSTLRVGSHAGIEHMPDIGVYEQRCRTCGQIEDYQSDHQAAVLAPLILQERAEAVRDAAAAGVRSIFDIWGAGGRRTVRMEELQNADAKILRGEWDNHIGWNIGDIAKERARAAAIDPEGAKE